MHKQYSSYWFLLPTHYLYGQQIVNIVRWINSVKMDAYVDILRIIHLLLIVTIYQQMICILSTNSKYCETNFKHKGEHTDILCTIPVCDILPSCPWLSFRTLSRYGDRTPDTLPKINLNCYRITRAGYGYFYLDLLSSKRLTELLLSVCQPVVTHRLDFNSV